ncbi:helix-turn-helix domain-containing protein [Streptomyces sp. SCA3-4]|uniref:helix-turn-helix domain-containing protein n=1 Tax=Streptomyces sichuanensis TaxID=2871810 RepID=UPI001CE34EC7|nr:helix-turn-helix transcriptional regulator [Streptomyces sichuanensis]MCA6093063.1 helix-turn-helix domain-containing protein [Streptomyces sichuanensis]
MEQLAAGRKTARTLTRRKRMPPRSTPSERQRRLGAELRKLRTRARLSGDDVAALLQADRSRVSHIEAGRVDVPRNGLYKLLRAYGCESGPLFDALMDMAHDRGKGWWDEYKDVLARRALDLAELESRTTAIRAHDSSVIPGLLQTEDYAHAVITGVESERPHLDQGVRFRIERQRVLAGLRSYHAVIYEAALRMRIGDTNTMRKQLLKLIEIARLPHVTLQIFPFEGGAYSTFSRNFVLLGGPTPELDTLYREHPTSADFIGDGDVIADYTRMFERLTSLALAPVDPETAPESQETRNSLSLIQHALYELR